MSEHTHEVPLNWVPGIEPRSVEVTHAHSTKVEEPHPHTWHVVLHASRVMTMEEKAS